jgi:hypothetical protein
LQQRLIEIQTTCLFSGIPISLLLICHPMILSACPLPMFILPSL